ncbi:hypothetical protein CICLE_v10009288mg [Citrus x clementina]|uniref:RING-type domain-containing protein n=2 Tax=Citrus TaxID=2706 RepID=A0ACB8P4E2_CITSI|nr:hypothetical protein CICLE_v10009288mg [Citrus x clementina]KAH9804846.1 RING-type domain-containing protein [Citrus sinensis]
MGNKIGTSLTKSKLKKHRKEIEVVTSKVTYSEVNEELEEAYLTPKSHESELTDEETVNLGKRRSSNAETDDGTPSFVCEICVESRSLYDSFDVKGCSHFNCTSCIVRYIASKLEGNITNISCPQLGCEARLEFEDCRLILPDDVFARWGLALCESALVGHKKFYCPYKDCSSMLIDEGEAIRKSNCPHCRRLFCVQSKKKKWKRCPNCSYFVERSAGCFYMKCRCGNAFCYDCGARLITTTRCPSCNNQN